MITLLIGYLAAALTTGSFIPQAYKVYKTEQTRDISLGMFTLMTIGTLAWLIYGILVPSFPLIIANGISFVLSIYVLIIKIKHIKEGKTI